MYDLRKGDLFALCWARVRRVRRKSRGVLKYAVCLCKICDRSCVSACIVRREARCSCMGRVSVSSCRCMFVSVLYVCGSSQCCDLHDLQFVNAIWGFKRRP